MVRHHLVSVSIVWQCVIRFPNEYWVKAHGSKTLYFAINIVIYTLLKSQVLCIVSKVYYSILHPCLNVRKHHVFGRSSGLPLAAT